MIGVLKTKTQDSSYSGRDNDKASIPGTTYRALTGEKYVNNVIFQATSNFDTEPLKARILEILGKRKKFDPEDKEALSVWDTTGQFKFWDTFMLAFTGFLGVVGSLTLVVGGIGVSNIMNVVVEERTKEIGIKMALGAKQRFILGQFLLETLLVTGIGGADRVRGLPPICAVVPEVRPHGVRRACPRCRRSSRRSRWGSSGSSASSPGGSRRGRRRGWTRSWR